MRARGPVSPCINICTLNANGYCNGCRRSLEEIAGWAGFSADRQWAIMEQLPGRAALVDSVPAWGPRQ